MICVDFGKKNSVFYMMSDFHLDLEVLKINLFGHSFFVITLECQAGGDGRGANSSFVAPICAFGV